MGNRAVIVTEDTTRTNAQNKVGIYLHWCGGRECVEAFLAKAKEKGIRNPNGDPEYGWARLCQIIGDEFSADGNNDASLGVGIVAHMDTHNFDNGVYYIDSNWNIVKQTTGEEFDLEYKAAKELAKFYQTGSTGSFHTALFKAIEAADAENLERLKIAFPEYVLGLRDCNNPEVAEENEDNDYIPNID